MKNNEMNLGESIPRINSIAIILIIIFLINIRSGFLLTPYLTSLFGGEEYFQYSFLINIATTVKLTLGYLLNIALAVWAFREAKKQNEKPFIWTLFVLFFGLIAIVLFYLFLLIKELKIINKKLDKNNE